MGEFAGYIAGVIAIGAILYWIVFTDHDEHRPRIPPDRLRHEDRMRAWGRAVDKAKELSNNDLLRRELPVDSELLVVPPSVGIDGGQEARHVLRARNSGDEALGLEGEET